MNPAEAQAGVLVDELVRNGVRNVVLSPGSRNAPLSFALHAAAVAGRLALHVRIDERTAGFLALGLTRGSGEPVAVVCTSGTAVANLHPAVLEAHHSGQRLVAVTADRPAELVGSGANQTTEQHGVFGPLVPTVSMPLAEHQRSMNAVWRGVVCRALAADGPVHLNVPFREPLVPSGEGGEALDGRPGGAPWTTVVRPQVMGSDLRELGPRTLVLISDAPAEQAARAGALAARRGWPLLVEPPGAAPGGQLDHGTLLLNCHDELPRELRPDAVVVVGRPTLSRGVSRLLARTEEVHVVAPPARWADAGYRATAVHPALSAAPAGSSGSSGDSGWLARWREADAAAGAALTRFLAAEPWPNGLRLARDLVTALPADALLVLGSSNPIRDVDLAAPRRPDLRLLANRGLAGIDGTVSTAIGAALATGRPTCALLGDLTFLHDLNGLLIGPAEARPDLTLVVLNDDGGGIFALLEQGDPRFADAGFERVFGTPHGADLAALCAGYHVPHTLLTSPDDLPAAVTPGGGPRVVEVRADRGGRRDQQARLRAAVVG